MMQDTSVWLSSVTPPKPFPALTENASAEVVVIGGGIHGVTTAYFLAKAGKQVVLVEQDRIGQGDTGYTTAFVSYVIDKDLQELVKQFGEETAERVWQAGHEAIDLLEQIVAEEKIECEFNRTDLSIYAADEKGKEFIKNEHTIAQKLGYPLNLEPAESLAIKNYGVLVTPQNAKFHPLKYLFSLVKKCEELGVQFFENTPIQNIEHGKEIKLQTNKAEITTKNIVVATGAPTNSPYFLQAKIKPTNTYVIAGTMGKGTMPDGLYIDTETPYHYLRIDEHTKGERDYFILGGEDHPTGEAKNAEETFGKLVEYFRGNITEDFTVTHQWSGQILTSVDGLPYIGHHPMYRNELVGTCFGGDGMMFGVLAAKINSELILGKANSLADIFKPSRMTGMVDFMKHGMDIAKGMLQSYLPAGSGDFSQLKSGEGMVIEKHGKKVAVSKSSEGEVVAVSAKCTHMGCTVQWNSAQQTWDCPCHGSIFAQNGEVRRGPAVRALEKVSL